MSRQALKYAFGAIALYIVVARGTSTGTLVSRTTSGAATLVKAFQGR
jgi:hypothetical protein